MFHCELTGKSTQPGQKMRRVVMSVRQRTYENMVDGELKVSTGTEIVEEAYIGDAIPTDTGLKPLIVHEGKGGDTALAAFRSRALREGRSVYLTSTIQQGGKAVVKVIYEITPQGDIREIPPLGLAVGMLDHAQHHVMHWAATDPITGRHEGGATASQRNRHMAGIARFGNMVDAAQEALRATKMSA